MKFQEHLFRLIGKFSNDRSDYCPWGTRRHCCVPEDRAPRVIHGVFNPEFVLAFPLSLVLLWVHVEHKSFSYKVSGDPGSVLARVKSCSRVPALVVFGVELVSLRERVVLVLH